MKSTTSPAKPHKCRDGFSEDCKQCWDKRLKRMHLTMDRGRSVGSEDLTYGHDVMTLDFDGRTTYAFEPVDGERLDNGDWPISMR